MAEAMKAWLQLWTTQVHLDGESRAHCSELKKVLEPYLLVDLCLMCCDYLMVGLQLVQVPKLSYQPSSVEQMVPFQDGVVLACENSVWVCAPGQIVFASAIFRPGARLATDSTFSRCALVSGQEGVRWVKRSKSNPDMQLSAATPLQGGPPVISACLLNEHVLVTVSRRTVFLFQYDSEGTHPGMWKEIVRRDLGLLFWGECRVVAQDSNHFYVALCPTEEMDGSVVFFEWKEKSSLTQLKASHRSLVHGTQSLFTPEHIWLMNEGKEWIRLYRVECETSAEAVFSLPKKYAQSVTLQWGPHGPHLRLEQSKKRALLKISEVSVPRPPAAKMHKRKREVDASHVSSLNLSL